MATFTQFLEELTDVERTITVPPNEVERLVSRFGARVRLMGRWNSSGDGSLDIPESVLREAASQLGGRALREALQELKAEHFTKLLESSSAVALIDKIAEVYRVRFRELMTRYQETTDPAEAAQLRDRLVREVFGE
jgi:hypothetical protein